MTLVKPMINPERQTKRWPAAWCRYPKGPHTQSGVYLFRRTITLETAPTAYVVHITADQRYRLWVNGTPVCFGPARGDLLRWRYETVDIAPYLTAGENILAAQVYFMNVGLAPLAQITCEAAFLMQGDTDAESAVNTPDDWRVARDTAYTFSLDDMNALQTYCSIGPSEIMDMAQHPNGWEGAGFDTSDWQTPELVSRSYSAPYGIEDGESNWWLVPRLIPLMREDAVAFGRVVRSEVNGQTEKGDNRAGKQGFIIPAKSRMTILFDHETEVCAFPEITVKGGNGAKLRLAYAESLLPAGAKPNELGRKGNRNETEGRVLHGYADYWTLDGTARLLRPLWWKTFRYAELTIETQDDAVEIEKIEAIATGYPWKVKAGFHAPELADADKIWEVSWRTIECCTHETYVDCPYYEQLQYIGDTRIQALITQYMTGDARLYRKALWQLFDSRLPDGLTHSRYPSRIPQIIAPFSLWWVGMLHDFMMLVPGQDKFIRSLLPGVRSIVNWFRARLDTDTGLLGPLEWWCFGDWCTDWRFGTPPGAKEGGSTFMTLQLILALREWADMLTSISKGIEEAVALDMQADDLAALICEKCYDAENYRVADTPDHASYSQHAAILAVLADALPKQDEKAVMERVLADTDLSQATFYFRFYLNRALVKAGLGDKYIETLAPWRKMLEMGLTTWAENPEPTRSDCHAWSASPNYEFLATVLGIQSDATGFGSVEICPNLGTLTQASGFMPHPKGEIKVAYRRDGETLTADITLPEGLSGTLSWRDKESALTSGAQQITLTATE